jgi:hypothetical protein
MKHLCLQELAIRHICILNTLTHPAFSIHVKMGIGSTVFTIRTPIELFLLDMDTHLVMNLIESGWSQ